MLIPTQLYSSLGATRLRRSWATFTSMVGGPSLASTPGGDGQRPRFVSPPCPYLQMSSTRAVLVSSTISWESWLRLEVSSRRWHTPIQCYQVEKMVTPNGCPSSRRNRFLKGTKAGSGFSRECTDMFQRSAGAASDQARHQRTCHALRGSSGRMGKGGLKGAAECFG